MCVSSVFAEMMVKLSEDLRQKFKYELFTDVAEEIHCVCFDAAGVVKSRDALDVLLAAHKEVTMQLSVGPGDCDRVWQLAVLKLPRPGGARVYWSCHDLFEFLGLKTFGGWSSRWVWRSRSIWEKGLNVLFNYKGDKGDFFHLFLARLCV